jgi:DNA-binding CsgD family transcriptional regulator
MERVFVELSPRRDEIAQLYSCGFEKKEIANRLFRSVATVNTTIQRVFEELSVRNGRELTIKYAERLSGYDLKRGIISACLLIIFVLGTHYEANPFYRTRRSERIEERRDEA